MLRSQNSLSVWHGWLLIIMTGMICLGASLAVESVVDSNFLSFIPTLSARITDSVMLTLLGLCAAGAFVIYRLSQQNRLVTTALENMPQGLCMLDPAARLLLCNNRYLDIYRLTPEQVMPGCSLREILSHCREAGTFSGNVDRYATEYVAQIAQGKITSTAYEMKDGRIIALANRPMRGGGWIDTH